MRGKTEASLLIRCDGGRCKTEIVPHVAAGREPTDAQGMAMLAESVVQAMATDEGFGDYILSWFHDKNNRAVAGADPEPKAAKLLKNANARLAKEAKNDDN